ncbi:hypothetical protein N7510_000653 [Penicillium lagena]|uniref:uncharacterized protein n=1 Tax=Penicillium lagena TaxID=94218 RepID=UPI002541AE51|nr:uncharacterized protein N7510_000653 [Penicillium lagena]KAJ5624344.1 hypothetical protein N7510_000653 [Penicillium lagena]
MVSILKRIIHNDAMKVDPPEIYGWRVFVLTLTKACSAGMLFGMDTGVIGGVIVLPAFQAKYGFTGLSPSDSATLSANIVSTLQLGCFAGALAAYPVADKWGRRLSLIFFAFVGLVGIVLQFAASGFLSCMYLGRLLAGIGCGGASMAAPLYVSENAPRAIRGALTGVFQFFNTFGAMLAFWIDYGVQAHVHGAPSYIVPLALQGIPCIFLMFGMFLLSETPRFLAKQDKWEDARAVLAMLRQLPADHAYVEGELQDICQQLENERLLIGGAGFWSLQREMWTIPGNRNRALISFSLMMCQCMTGVNSINYYAPVIFESVGITGTSTGLFATGIYGVVKMVSCSCFLLFLADSLGRRKSLLWTSIAMGVAMFYIGLYIRISPPVKGAPIAPAGYVALVCIYLFAVFFQLGWGASCWIVVTEIPSARLRSMNVSLAAASQWLFNYVTARAVPSMLTNLGRDGYGTYIFFGSLCFTMWFFVFLCVPETKGLSLEKMDDLFGVTKLVDKEPRGKGSR